MYNTIQKTLAAWAFNQYIAYYYFDNVNVSQLTVAFDKGEVELENLPIKKDALKHFNQPMEVVSGVVGKLSIKVPLLTLLTDPWVIKISNLMLIVAPKKQDADNSTSTSLNSTIDECSASKNLSANQAQLNSDLLHKPSDTNLAETLDASSIYEFTDDTVNSEETKLAEFYSSFSSTVSSIVSNIYKNIRLEVESMTILFEDFEQGIVRFDVDSLLLHRPKSMRNIIMDNVAIYLSGVGASTMQEGEDLLRVSMDKCSLDIHDEASINMQLVVVHQNDSSSSNSTTSSSMPKQLEANSETRIDGNLKNISIERLTGRSSRKDSNVTEPGTECNRNIFLSKRDIMKCDNIRIEFKLNASKDDELIRLDERNLQLKLDLSGMQYIHSQNIYDITTERLKNLLKFFIRLQSKQPSNSPFNTTEKNQLEVSDQRLKYRNDSKYTNKLLMINIEDGLLYVVDDNTGSSAIPLLEISLSDCRILQISNRTQQDGMICAKVGCCYYNREVSSWDVLLKPWAFNLSWDLKSTGHRRKIQNRKLVMISEESAEFFLSSALLDLGDVALKRIIDSVLYPKLKSISRSIYPSSHQTALEFNSIFVIHNETGHRLHFAPLEQNHDLFDLSDSRQSSPTMDLYSGDNLGKSLMQKLSIQSVSSSNSRDSPDLNCLAKWTSVDAGETVSFEFESQPIYRRRNSDLSSQLRVILVRVEGWKTLTPISLDKTGLFFCEALSDRVVNEDTYIAISINLEERSARKVISVMSPLNLVNKLDTTLEVHFKESNQTLYLKPDSHLAVPLPFLANQMHIRPCNVGVTMSEEALTWDSIQRITNHESKIQICHPITVTNERHASFCKSYPFRVCVSTKREEPRIGNTKVEPGPLHPTPVFSMSFIPPLTLVNLLPCDLQYFIGDVEGSLDIGSQQKIYHVDTTRPADLQFRMNGYPQSKPINIDPGATGSFNHILEMIDERNRSLYLTAEIIIVSRGEEPAVQVIIYAPFWFINKTRLPIIFKQEGAALEAAGQFSEHEEAASPILLFSYYDTELELPWLCSMRLGKSKGASMWCDGFKLEKGIGERKLSFTSKDAGGRQKPGKTLIDINIARGFGRYSNTNIVTFTARYGFGPLSKTPKKATEPSPHNYKLTSFNHNANLAERMAGQAVNLFNSHQHRTESDFDLKLRGFRLTLIDSQKESFMQASVDNIIIEGKTNAKEQILDCTVQDIRIENTLPDCEKCIILDKASSLDQTLADQPSLRLIMNRMLGNPFGTTLFRQVQVTMCELVLNMEEKLVLKFVEFVSLRNRRRRRDMDSLSHDLDRILNPEDDRKSKYYFDLLRIDLSSLKLSVFTSNNLATRLQKLKSYLGLKFFGFEEAQVHLSPYFKINVIKTFQGVVESVARFYKRQLIEQAPRIVGQQIQNYLRFHLSDLLSTLYDEVYNKLFN